MKWQTDLTKCFPYFVWVILLTVFVRNNFFFWDTVQFSGLHPSFFYENGFSKLILPPEIDSGHPPFFGMYLAWMWKIFGKSLAVSHLAMLPFLIGIVWYAYDVGSYYLGRKNAVFFLMLLLIDPVFAGQSVLVSPDIALICFFLMAWNSILENRKWVLIIATALLVMISMRGMMLVVALFVFDLIFNKRFTIAAAFKTTFPYVLSGVISLAYLIYHQQQTGWIGYHADSSWSTSFDKVSLKGFVRNIGILIWRIIDFGRLIPILLIAYLIFRKSDAVRLKSLIQFLVIAFLILTPSLLIHKGLLGNRYLLPIFVIIDLLVLKLIFNKVKDVKWRRVYLVLIIGTMALGNLLVYPRHVAQGWDSTLGHLPYYELRRDAIDFMKKEKIPFSKTGTTFPNTANTKYIDLSNENWQFAKKDLETNEYLFYSNVFNEFTDEELRTLELRWRKIYEAKKIGIEVIIYKHP